MARDSTESRFLEVLHRFGGPQHVQLVGELWERAESRALLEGFLRDIFPAELPPGADLLKSKAAQEPGGDQTVSRCRGSSEPGGDHTAARCKGTSEPGGDDQTVSRCRGTSEPGGDIASRCKGSSEHRAQEGDSHTTVIPPPAPPPKADRTLSFGLVFFLCRADSLRLRGASRQLREIMRDVRERMPAGGAVIGVVMKADSSERSDGNVQEMGLMCEDGGCSSAVSALLAMLQSVFPLQGRGRLCAEVRASVLIPGQEETRREIQRLACEALTAADELRKLKPKMKTRCFSWRRRRKWKDCVEKEFIQEGTALTALQYSNGDCTETITDA